MFLAVVSDKNNSERLHTEHMPPHNQKKKKKHTGVFLTGGGEFLPVIL